MSWGCPADLSEYLIGFASVFLGDLFAVFLVAAFLAGDFFAAAFAMAVVFTLLI
jgi:uncharacterized membrane protein